MRKITLAAMLLAGPARAGILDAVFSNPKAEAVDKAQYAGLTHLIIVSGATAYKPAQEELLARVESGLRESGCWRLMGHIDAGERIKHAALRAPSPVSWDNDVEVSSALLEDLPKRDEKLGILIFWVTDWRGQAYSNQEGGYGRDAVAQVFDSATGDQVWRGHMIIPSAAAGGDARLPAADKARREDRALSEYNLFSSFFVDALRHPPNVASACRPPAEAQASVSAGMKAVMDPVVRATARLKSPNASARAEAAKTLGQTEDDAAVGPLIQALSDRDLMVRAYALDALGELGNADAVDAVAAKLSDESKLLRALAARALGRIGSARGAPALEKLLNTEEDPLVRKAAEESLQKVGPVTTMTAAPPDRGIGRP